MTDETLVTNTKAPRREAVLAYIIEHIARYGTSPSYVEIGRHLCIGSTRVRQLVDQLIKLKLVERTPGSQRAFRVVDMGASREVLGRTLQRLGWIQAPPMGTLQADPIHAPLGWINGPLPLVAILEHLPEHELEAGDAGIGGG